MSTDDATSPKLRVVPAAQLTPNGFPLTITVHTSGRAQPAAAQARDHFPPTQWGLLELAANRNAPGSAEALAKICENYWYPVYAYMRRRRGEVVGADLTQDFFEMLIGTDMLGKPDREKGSFGGWLFGTMNRFLANEYRHWRAGKRDVRVVVHLDALTAEKRYLLEPPTNVSPEKLYERNVTLAVLDEIAERVRSEFRDRDELFDALIPYLRTAEVDALDFERIAGDFALTPIAVKQRLYRLRLKFRKLLIEEVGTENIAALIESLNHEDT